MTRSPTSSRPRIRPSRWMWGFGISAPAAAAACVCLILLFSNPGVDMVVYRDAGQLVRSEAGMPLKSGDVLRGGEHFRVKITAHRDGFVYLYLYDPQQGGDFLFPSPSVPGGNRVVKGETFVMPPDGSWVVDDSGSAEETLYLLSSPSPVRPDQIGGIAGEVAQADMTPSRVGKILGRHFSIEQTFRYRHR